MRIVSLCPSNTEQLAYLGLTASLIGVDNYSDWPPEVHALPRLGPDLDIDMDRVQALEPDLVAASLSVPGMEKNIEELKQRNLPHITLNPNSLQEVGEDLLQLGEATDTYAIAQSLYTQYTEILQYFEEQTKHVQNKPTLYWEWWPKPIFTPGAKNWLTYISDLAGGVNVFADQSVASVQTNWNEVYERNPDHICLVWVGVEKEKIRPELVRQRPGWEELPAIQNNYMYVLDEPLFCRPSLRLLTGLWKIGHTLHPHLFPAYEEGKDALDLVGR